MKHNIGVVDNSKNKYKFFDANKWIDDKTTTYYFISQRNIGKTTWMWNKILDDYFNHGKSSLYMRRFFAEIESYKADVKKIIKILREKYNYDVWLQGTTIYCGEEILCEMISLSTAYNKASGNYDNISCLYFDEVQTRSHYLQEEYKTFVDFVATCERYNSNFKVFMFGNALSKNNPYLSTWGIWDLSKKVMTYDIIKVVMVQEGIDVILPDQTHTTAYRLSQHDPRVGGYMYENKFAFDDDTAIMYAKEVENKLAGVRWRLQLDQVKYEVYRLTDGKCWCTSVFNYTENKVRPTFALTLFDGMLSKGDDSKKADLAEWMYEATKKGMLSYNSESSRDNLFKWCCSFVDIEEL